MPESRFTRLFLVACFVGVAASFSFMSFRLFHRSGNYLADAAEKGNLAGVQSYLERNQGTIDPVHREAALREAILTGQSDMVGALLAQGAFSSEAERMHLFHLACSAGQSDCVLPFLDRGFGPNEIDESTGWTAMHFAALSGNADVIQTLLDAGGDPSVLNAHGITPMEVAETASQHQDAMAGSDFNGVIAVLAQAR